MKLPKRYVASELDWQPRASRVAVLVLLLTFMTAGLAYFWYRSLPLTAVAANNSIYQSASVFVFIFSVILIKEKVTLQKIAAVVVSVAGVACISTAPSNSHSSDVHPEPIGYLWVVISTIMYALYEVCRAAAGVAATCC